VIGLSAEVKEKLFNIRPVSLGQASRISGVTPAPSLFSWSTLKNKVIYKKIEGWGGLFFKILF